MVPQTRANIFICLLDHTYKAQLANIKMERQRWPEKPLILGRSGTQYVAMETKLLSLHCGAHLVQPYCRESNISDTNWLRYRSFAYFKPRINICYLPIGRSVLGKTVPEVLNTDRPRPANNVLKTKGTVFPNTDRPRPANNVFIFFSLENYFIRNILLIFYCSSFTPCACV